jgi:hypothetical protein
VTALIRTLLRACLEPAESEWVAGARAELESASESEYSRVLIDLHLHRMTPFVGYAIRTHGLGDLLPAEFRSQCLAVHRDTSLANSARMHRLANVLHALEERGIEPVVLKGGALADGFYPDLGARSMSDVDLVIERNQIPSVREAFESVGVPRAPALDAGDALQFADPMGITFDVHYRFRLFEGQGLEGLTTVVPTQRLSFPRLRVLEPSAMVVHLVHHMGGHRSGSGYLLRWLIDLLLVLRSWGDRLEPDRLLGMLPSESDLALLLRALRFFEVEFGESLPGGLAPLPGGVPAIGLQEVLRQRLLALWGLPWPRGWARLGATRVGARARRGLPYPSWGDLRRWPADVLQARQALGRARRLRACRSGP